MLDKTLGENNSNSIGRELESVLIGCAVQDDNEAISTEWENEIKIIGNRN